MLFKSSHWINIKKYISVYIFLVFQLQFIELQNVEIKVISYLCGRCLSKKADKLN